MQCFVSFPTFPRVVFVWNGRNLNSVQYRYQTMRIAMRMLLSEFHSSHFMSTVGNSANRHDTLLYLIDIHDPWLQEESYSKRLGVVSPH
mmetsp:Transcript_23355/g.57466  ORF Transcript_23355/g.57466 Transcript_23355/m.57466 type:complete len:89 (+) Transcript_23355:89-355(+)